MNRRAFLCGMISTALAAPLTTDARPAGKVYRIGLLGPSSPPTDPGAARLWEALLQGLREQGYVEGQNVRFERRYSEGMESPVCGACRAAPEAEGSG